MFNTTEFSQMSPDTCLKIEYNFCHVGLFLGNLRQNFQALRFKSILHLNLSEIKKKKLQDIRHSRNSAKEQDISMSCC